MIPQQDQTKLRYYKCSYHGINSKCTTTGLCRPVAETETGEMRLLPPEGFQKLVNTVGSRCTRCGACCTVCPFKVLECRDGPQLSSECRDCGQCLQVCPAYQVDMSELEKTVFGHMRAAEDTFGIHLSTSIGQAHNVKIKEVCQDGGAVTALLVNGFNINRLDGAVVSSVQPSAPWLPRPLLARSVNEVVEAAGSRYCYSAGLTVLSKSLEQGLSQLAFVGLPCQVLALRKMQKAGFKRIVGNIKLIIGLFCSESFTYEGLIQRKICKEMGIDLNDISKMNIKRIFQIRLRNGQTREIPLKEIRQYAEPFCRFCSDFSSELADISLGGVGLENDTFIIPRTEVGKTFLEEAVKSGAIDLAHPPREKEALGTLIRLSKNKHDKGLKEDFKSEARSFP